MKKPIDVAALFPEVNQIQDQELRAKVVAVWEELWGQSEWQDVNDIPTSSEIPSPHVPHNRCLLAISLAIADAYEKFHGVRVNRDYLIAGGLLQDVSKLVESRPGGEGRAEPTEIRNSYPHGFWGAHIAIQHGVPAAIAHIILHHSPKSPKFPDSLEGKILYYADQLDVIAIHKDRFTKVLSIANPPAG